MLTYILRLRFPRKKSDFICIRNNTHLFSRTTFKMSAAEAADETKGNTGDIMPTNSSLVVSLRKRAI